MKQILFFSMLLMLVSGCNEITSPIGPDLSQKSSTEAISEISKSGGVVARPFKMSNSHLSLDWGIVAAQEAVCGGGRIAGGLMTGEGNFTHLGRSTLDLSAAWDIARLIPSPQFVPTSPAAAGPVATVLSGNEYPYQFHFDPVTQQCGTTVSATGELTLTAANGDQLFGTVTGGETFRLDFINPGDGIETFAIIAFTGGTGRFQNATGSFVAHTISRFDYAVGKFVIDLAEVLPGGTLAY